MMNRRTVITGVAASAAVAAPAAATCVLPDAAQGLEPPALDWAAICNALDGHFFRGGTDPAQHATDSIIRTRLAARLVGLSADEVEMGAEIVRRAFGPGTSESDMLAMLEWTKQARISLDWIMCGSLGVVFAQAADGMGMRLRQLAFGGRAP